MKIRNRKTHLRVFAGVTLACLLFCVKPVDLRAADAVPQTLTDAHTLAKDSAALEAHGDLQGAAQKARLVLASPAFSALTSQDQYFIHAVIGLADLQANNLREALDMLKLACDSGFAGADLWLERFSADRKLDDPDGVQTLATIAINSPKSLGRLNPFAVDWASKKSVTMSDRATIALIGALRAAHWQATDRYDRSDTPWLYLARAYLDGGDTKDAAAAMEDVNSVASLVAARSEKLFDPVINADPGHFDVAKAAQAEIEKYQQWAKEDPDRLAAVNELAEALNLANRQDDAIAVIDAALARIRAAGSGPSPFKDKKDYYSFVLDTRASALWHAGRIQESLDQEIAAARELEDGGQNISQTLDLAEDYNNAGKPHDALALTAALTLDRASPYGDMVLEDARACAYAQLNDTTNVQAAILYMRAHADDAPRMMFDAYICANDLDSAAQNAIAQLGDPKTRSAMLIELQDFAEKDYTAVEIEMRKRLIAVRSRPDVTAAIAPLGHINSFPVRKPFF